jgi:hypothetical protein
MAAAAAAGADPYAVPRSEPPAVWRRLESSPVVPRSAFAASFYAAPAALAPRFVVLPSCEPEYDAVVRRLGVQASHYVVGVECVANHMQWSGYVGTRDWLAESAGAGAARELWLVHGTDAASARKIALEGFDRDENRRALHGRGSYFAVLASTALGYAPADAAAREHTLLLCRVIVGESQKGEKDKPRPDLKSDGSGVRYGSMVDDLAKPNVFVVSRDRTVFPEYIVRLAALPSAAPVVPVAPPSLLPAPAASAAAVAPATDVVFVGTTPEGLQSRAHFEWRMSQPPAPLPPWPQPEAWIAHPEPTPPAAQFIHDLRRAPSRHWYRNPGLIVALCDRTMDTRNGGL